MFFKLLQWPEAMNTQNLGVERLDKASRFCRGFICMIIMLIQAETMLRLIFNAPSV